MNSRSVPWSIVSLLLAALPMGCGQPRSTVVTSPASKRFIPPQISSAASWPWLGTNPTKLERGITQWTNRSSPDGTAIDLIEFDFAANPRLRVGLYDQDEDDSTPGDGKVDCWPMGVVGAVRHLQEERHIEVWAACNGLFFIAGEKRGTGHEPAQHIAPVVLNGVSRYNVGNHRWTFGWKEKPTGIDFKVLHLPSKDVLSRKLTFGAAGAQALVQNGKPLQTEPFPNSLDEIKRGAQPSTPNQVGHIPTVDHMRTSRTSVAWSHDSKKLWLLIVKEPDNETQSAIEFRHGEPMKGGWTVAELQQFWISRGAWGAVNFDGGDVTQAVWKLTGGEYEFIPARQASGSLRTKLPSSLTPDPGGGSIMYFYVYEVSNSNAR